MARFLLSKNFRAITPKNGRGIIYRPMGFPPCGYWTEKFDEAYQPAPTYRWHIIKETPMNWKFWKKNDNVKTFSHAKKQGFEKPRELPEEVGRHLVVQQGADPDWVWSLKCLRSPKENSSSQFNIRIFSPETMAQHNVKVTNYASLEEHMDLVIFVGWYDKKTQNVQIDRLIKEVV